MNGLQYAVAAWLPILIFPQTMAPSFRRGFPATFAFVIAGLILIVVIQLLHVREQRQGKASGAPVELEAVSDDGVVEYTGEEKIGGRVGEAKEIKDVV